MSLILSPISEGSAGGAIALCLVKNLAGQFHSVVQYVPRPGAGGTGIESILNPMPVGGVGGGNGSSRGPSTPVYDASVGHRLTILPPLDGAARLILHVCGQSGAGKSEVLKRFTEDYRLLYPDRPVYLISNLDSDKTMDSLSPPVSRIDIQSLVSKPEFINSVTKWADSLVLFDDIEELEPSRAVVVQRLLDQLCVKGRHTHTTVVRSSHLSTDGAKSRVLLREAHGFVIFPNHGVRAGYHRLLRTYMGLKEREIDEVLSLPNRWVYIHVTHPKFVQTEDRIRLV